MPVLKKFPPSYVLRKGATVGKVMFLVVCVTVCNRFCLLTRLQRRQSLRSDDQWPWNRAAKFTWWQHRASGAGDEISSIWHRSCQVSIFSTGNLRGISPGGGMSSLSQFSSTAYPTFSFLTSDIELNFDAI